MLNQIKSSYTIPSPRSEAKALVEAFARQEKQRLYPFELKNFTLGVRFQNADPQTQRVIVMAMLAWLDQHSLKSSGAQDQKAWQMGWKVREAFLHMLRFKIPFQEQDIIAMLNWSATQSTTPAYVYFSGAPQIIKVVAEYLQRNPMTDELHEAIDRLTQSMEMESMSIEIRRWLMRLKELMGEKQVGLPLVAGDLWADAALKELYALDSRTKTAWAELLTHCSRSTSPAPTRKWLNEADPYIKIIGNLNFFTKLLHWFPLIDKQETTLVNANILKGLVWLCSKSEDVEIARALRALALSCYEKLPSSELRSVRIGKACIWALGKMPVCEAITQLGVLKATLETAQAQKLIVNALKTAAKRFRIPAKEIEEMTIGTAV